jgi:hypothetical protein
MNPPLWMFDTSRSELVYCDPQAGPIRFPFAVVAEFAPSTTLGELRKALPRSDASPLVGRGGLRLQ